jgi:hypothetical protein
VAAPVVESSASSSPSLANPMAESSARSSRWSASSNQGGAVIRSGLASVVPHRTSCV